MSETLFPFGKHRGEKITDIPRRYLGWLLRECDLREPLRAEVEAAYNRKPMPKSDDERIAEMFDKKYGRQ
jgi:hypothetical protein